ncbi:Glu/Leu/Phe/Val dehydrogenase dimerization domain-containing protein [Kitasatospora sp. NBC_01539]|uniref:Glu/Leu/Phe/Val dehydrogenase dimerization domain-containing protein n=1 Tax=Kitasatospora sp. NBC_01539 TaxID=2903577 RepID=UPI0038600B71
MKIRVFVDNDESDLHAFVIVDSLAQGRAMGGTRMTPGVTPDEVAELARKMTMKLALAGLDIGGAKAGIVCGLPLGAERDRVLAEFGKAVSPLLHGGLYLGGDQGISHRDRDVFFDAAGFDATLATPADDGLPCSWAELWKKCSDVTGFGVCEGIDQGVDSLGIRGECRTVAIQGFGCVGSAVAAGLTARGFTVVAVADREGTVSAPEGLPLEALLAATDSAGTIDRSRLPEGLCLDSAPDAWLDVDADILVLAAGGDAVTEANAHRVRAKLLAEGGNCTCTPGAQDALDARGVKVLPDIVVNTGGAAVTGLLLTGQAPAEALADADALTAWLYREVGRRIRRSVDDLLALAEANGSRLMDAAAELAADRLAGRTARPSLV